MGEAMTAKAPKQFPPYVHPEPEELGDVMRQAFIGANRHDKLEWHEPWKSLPLEKRNRYNVAALAVLSAWRDRQ